MGYIQPKTDFQDGDVLYGNDLNASNATIKAGVDDNFERILDLETEKQDAINIYNKLDYSLLENTPDIPTKTSDLTNDSGFIDNSYHDNTKQDTLTAGTGIDITNNVISNTQTSAEWGNIQGDITDQTDLVSALGTKQDVIDSSHKLDYDLLSNTPTIPSKTSDLINDNNTVIDASYVHTDNNYSDIDKGKLEGIESGAEENTIETIKVDSTALTPDANKAVNIDLSGKQDTLVSGTNIKTINNIDLLGSGNIDIGGGSGGTSNYNNLENKPQINNVTLAGNKSLSDLGINIPTKTSDLNNDSNFVVDANYVHIDNNYTSAEKTKLSGIESGAEVNDIDTIKVNGTTQTITSKAVDITVPTKLSDLNNDNNTVTDASYVHTDNNYTSSEKAKLSGIESGAQVNVDEVVVSDETAITEDTKLYIESTDLDGQYLPVEEDIYSTTETKTNKVWIDGKDIYRKVIRITLTDTQQSTPINVNNVSKITSFDGVTATGLPINFYFQPANTFISTFVDTYNIYNICSPGYSGNTADVTVEYTKTS